MDFGTRVFKERKALRTAARRLGVPAQDVDDVVSRTFLRALELADRYEEQGTLRAWLVTVMRGLVSNDRRMAQTRRTVLTAFDDEEDGHEVWREAVRSPAAQEREIAAAEALAVIAGLPQDQRDVIEAVTIGGISYADYAAARGLTLGTVKSRLSRALCEVRAQLEATGGRGAAARSAGAAGAAGTAGARRKRQDNRTDCSEAAALVIGGTAPGVPAATAAAAARAVISPERNPATAPRALAGMPVAEGTNAPERQGEAPAEDKDIAAPGCCLDAAARQPAAVATCTRHARGNIAPEHRNGATPDRGTAEAGEQAPGVPLVPQITKGPAALADRQVHDLQRLLAQRFGVREGADLEAAADAAPPASARQNAKVAPDHGGVSAPIRGTAAVPEHVSPGAPEHGSAAPLDRCSGARAEHGAADLSERENAEAGDPDPVIRPSSRQAA